MPSAENMSCAAITLLYTNGIITAAERDRARKRLAGVKECLTTERGGTVKNNLTVTPVRERYRFKDGEVHLCWACGALPCDGALTAWEQLPWIVHFKMAHFPRFLIDRRDPDNPDMFSGYKINGAGSIGNGIGLGTGEGGRLNFHRSHFIEDLPA